MKFYFLLFRESVIKAYECDCSHELILLVFINFCNIYLFCLYFHSLLRCLTECFFSVLGLAILSTITV